MTRGKFVTKVLWEQYLRVKDDKSVSPEARLMAWALAQGANTAAPSISEDEFLDANIPGLYEALQELHDAIDKQMEKGVL